MRDSMTRIKTTLRRIVFLIPGTQTHLKPAYRRMRRVQIAARSSFHDFRTAARHLTWVRRPGRYWSLSSELLFQFHKLEKGLSLPIEARRFFGVRAAQETCRLLVEWEKNREDLDSSVFLGAIEAVRAWRDWTKLATDLDSGHDALFALVDSILARHAPVSPLTTPIPLRAPNLNSPENFHALMLERRSVRDFDTRKIDMALIEKAVATAQLSPSACNRQPWHLHLYDDPAAIQALLALQNGNAGFGHTVPLLAVVTSNLTSFFDASERIEPALDAGLFLMSFLLALQSHGISSCCLNWAVLPDVDRAGHSIGRIPDNEQILTFVAIGMARHDVVVPLSVRRPVSDVIRHHNGLEFR